MAKLISINQLRSIEWSKRYLWEVYFVKPDLSPAAPFDKWLPAISCSDEDTNITAKVISANMTDFAIPLEQKKKEFKISFIDDINLTIYSWFRRWVEVDIFNAGSGMSAIENCTRLIRLNKFDNNLDIISAREYLVFPISVSIFSGSSEDTPHTVEVTLQKIGRNTQTLFETDSERSAGSSVFGKTIFNKVAGGVSYLSKK